MSEVQLVSDTVDSHLNRDGNDSFVGSHSPINETVSSGGRRVAWAV